MNDSSLVDEFWSAFLASRFRELPPDLSYYEAFCFGNGADMADRLAALVRSGVKTATSALLREFEESGRRPPHPGDLSVVLDGAGRPVCVIETIESSTIPFDQVDESFAVDYGEGDRTLEWWHENLWRYYVEECAVHGWIADRRMLLVCERFRVVYDPLSIPGSDR